MTDWIYDGKPFEGDSEFLKDFTSFVYVIRDNETGKQYFGKKRLLFVRHKRSVRRKNRIKVIQESDWRNYWGSNDQLKLEIERRGTQCFTREILRFCRRLSESSYYELKFQMINDVLLHPDKFYNSYVGGRISRKQLGIK